MGRRPSEGGGGRSSPPLDSRPGSSSGCSWECQSSRPPPRVSGPRPVTQAGVTALTTAAAPRRRTPGAGTAATSFVGPSAAVAA